MLRLPYFAEKAVDSFRSSLGASVLTTLTIGTALLLMSSFVVGLQNLEKLAEVWGRVARVVVYLEDGLALAEMRQIEAQARAIDGAESARLVTAEQALERLRARGEETAALLEGVSADLLEASLEIAAGDGFADLVATEQLAARLAALEGVLDVDYGQQDFDRLQALLQGLRFLGATVGLLLALATGFIVSNTIRLAVYARRDEIEILRLVGATPWFIRWPFLIEGALMGVLGGGLAAGLSLLAEQTLAPQLNREAASVLGGLEVHFFAAEVALLTLFAGVLVGGGASLLAVRRFLLAAGNR